MVLTDITVAAAVMTLDVMMTVDDHSILTDLSIHTTHVINRTVATIQIAVAIVMVMIKVE